MKQNWHTLSEAALRVGVSTKTIIRWEKAGKISKSKRDWRGWRIYSPDDIKLMEEMVQTVYY